MFAGCKDLISDGSFNSTLFAFIIVPLSEGTFPLALENGLVISLKNNYPLYNSNFSVYCSCPG